MKNKFSILKKINPYEIIPNNDTTIVAETENSSQISEKNNQIIQEESTLQAEKIPNLKSLFNKKDLSRKKTCTFTLKKNNIDFLAKFSKSTNISRSEILDKLIEVLSQENIPNLK